MQKLPCYVHLDTKHIIICNIIVLVMKATFTAITLILTALNNTLLLHLGLKPM